MAGLLLVSFALTPFAREVRAESPDWLRGTGEDLEIRLAGNFVDVDGVPLHAEAVDALDFRVELKTMAIAHAVPVEFREGRFEAWIPVQKHSWFSINLTAKDKPLNRIGCESIGPSALRQAAIDGISVELLPASRSIEVVVTDDGEPIAEANVSAFVFNKNFTGLPLEAITNSKGIATLSIPEGSKINQLVAWTDDLRVGGYTTARVPELDGSPDTFPCELDPAREQIFRCVDEKGIPVANLPLKVEVATTDYNYLGDMPQAQLITDQNGQAIHACFPDWESHHCYLEMIGDEWYCAGDLQWENGIATQVVSRMPPRLRLTGTLAEADAAGVSVSHNSFQHPRENRMERMNSFVDAEGKFLVETLPGRTYLSFVDHPNLVSESFAWTAPEFPGDESAVEKLRDIAVQPGIPITVKVVSGLSERPMIGASVSASSEREFIYAHERFGRTSGSLGRRTSAMTNEEGIATLRVPPGETKVMSWWNSRTVDETITVDADSPAEVLLHHKVDAAQKIAGTIIVPPDSDVSVADAHIEIASIDGQSRQQLTAEADAAGNFEFEITSSKIVILAESADGKAHASTSWVIDDDSIALTLKPGTSFRGRLTTDDGAPIVDHLVSATATVESSKDSSSPFSRSGSAELGSWQTRTDADGRFEFDSLPSELSVTLRAEPYPSTDAPNVRPEYLGKVFLRPDQTRPLWTETLGDPAPSGVAKTTPRPVSQIVDAWLKDCRRDHYHLLVMRIGDSDLARASVNKVLRSYDDFRPITRYLNCEIASPDELLDEDVKYLAERDWPVVQPGEFFAAALDASGEELGRVQLDITLDDFQTKFESFVVDHCPEQVDAMAAWDAAFAEAKQTGRRVWATSGGRYCGPCFMLSRWQDKHRDILDREFVFFKVDAFSHEDGEEIAKRITLGQSGGIPFHAVFDADGTRIMDSLGPLGNIGMPGGFEGTEHLGEMMRTGRVQIIDDEIEQLVESLR